MSIRLKRLYNEYQEIAKYFANNPFIVIKGIFGNPPEKYNIEYRIKGLTQNENDIIVKDFHMVEITLPSEYPTIGPICRMMTPIFHPNVDLNKICIADFWAAGESLIDVIVRIGEIISYQNYNIKSPLNGEAAKWAEQNISRFPIDTVDLTLQIQSSINNPMITDERTKPIDEKVDISSIKKVCSNCGAYGDNINFKKCKKEGHLLCPDCIIECQSCGKPLCICCSSNNCDTCGKVLCDKCKTICTSCGNVLCKDEICCCIVCQCGASGKDVQLIKCSNGHLSCPDCIIGCDSCGKVLCVLCSFNKCPDCGKIFCNDCHHICQSSEKLTSKQPDMINDNTNQKASERIFNSISNLNHIPDSKELNKNYKLCKKCGHTTKYIDAHFCEMCGEILV